MLSRFRSDAEQKQVVEQLAGGAVDIIIGTHRLIQKDVKFKDLGLVVIDEEQRFGVAHKEHLKKMRREVDVLTLSATPIPRTLYMALGGIRDMSTMETPPEERLPIKTYVSEFDERIVREAIIARARARRPGLLRAQPRAQHRPHREQGAATSCPKRVSPSATARWTRRAGARDGRLHARPDSTCWSAPRSSSPASTSRT